MSARSLIKPQLQDLYIANSFESAGTPLILIQIFEPTVSINFNWYSFATAMHVNLFLQLYIALINTLSFIKFSQFHPDSVPFSVLKVSVF